VYETAFIDGDRAGRRRDIDWRACRWLNGGRRRLSRTPPKNACAKFASEAPGMLSPDELGASTERRTRVSPLLLKRSWSVGESRKKLSTSVRRGVVTVLWMPVVQPATATWSGYSCQAATPTAAEAPDCASPV
jgi:hypothetical protein